MSSPTPGPPTAPRHLWNSWIEREKKGLGEVVERLRGNPEDSYLFYFDLTSQPIPGLALQIPVSGPLEADLRNQPTGEILHLTAHPFVVGRGLRFADQQPSGSLTQTTEVDVGKLRTPHESKKSGKAFKPTRLASQQDGWSIGCRLRSRAAPRWLFLVGTHSVGRWPFSAETLQSLTTRAPHRTVRVRARRPLTTDSVASRVPEPNEGRGRAACFESSSTVSYSYAVLPGRRRSMVEVKCLGHPFYESPLPFSFQVPAGSYQ